MARSKAAIAEMVAARSTPDAVTCSVPEAGLRFFGLGENASYRAAERGDIPVIQVGGRKRVPIKAMEQRVAGAA